MNYQAIASQGRYGDTTLVHMTPQEVSGLNALGAAYGRPMTINPTTGYPEAFNLRNLLPTIIGAGLNIASGGTLTPLMAGMMTGAGYAVATGDPMKGLTAGLGAAGGAGIGSGLTAAGSTAMPVQGASTMAQNFARAGEGIKALGTEQGLDLFMGTPATSAVPATGVGGVGGLAKSTAMALTPEITDVNIPKPPEQVSYIRPYSLDIENVSGTPYSSSAEQQQLTYRFKEEEPYRVAQGGHIRYQEGGPVDGVSAPAADVYRSIANIQQMAGLPVIDIPSVRPMPINMGAALSQPEVGSSIPTEFVDPAIASGITRGDAFSVDSFTDMMKRVNNRDVGPVTLNTPQGQIYTPIDYNIDLPSPEKSSIYASIQPKQKKTPFGRPAQFGEEPSVPFGRPAREGGLASMRDGRFLSGNGDGMSDEIPASIEGEVDALLSDGEFVIPADVVSHLGNGSSAAGAKVLYKMMDRIRKERTGKEEQAEEVEVEKILPA